MSAPGTSAERLAVLLSEIGEVAAVDAESVVVAVGSTRASLRVVGLGEGLDIITVIQMLADDATNTPELRDRIEAIDAGLSFGGLRRSQPGEQRTDVLLYYTFPAGNLDDHALLTVLHIVLTSGADAAAELAGSRDGRG